MSAKTFLMTILIFIASVVCIQADEVRIKSHCTGRVKAKNTRLLGKNENGVEAHVDPKAPAAFQEIDDLSRDVKQTLATLQKDIEEILSGIRNAVVRKSTIESEKQTIEMLTVESDVKKQTISILAGEIKDVSGQIDGLAALYRQKDNEFRNLSVKLNELDIKRKGLSELYTVSGSFKNINMGAAALNLSAKFEDITSLHKRIDDFLSDASSPKAVEEKVTGTQVSTLSPSISSEFKNAPKWILDEIKSKGRRIETSYGDMVVAKDGRVTIISIRKENDVQFKSAYAKLIKETYESNGTEYFVLGSGS